MPFELTEKSGYFVVRCYGIVSPDDLAAMVHRAIEVEAAHPDGIDRIADFSDVEVFNIQYATVSDFAKARRQQTFPRTVKSALVADRPVAMGFARMYQTILNHPQIELCIFPTMEEAVAWVTGGSA
jgi:hypothetical protein